MKPYLIALLSILGIGFAYLIGFFAHQGGLPLLSPSGLIGLAERDMMVRAVLLMLVVVIPVYVLIILVAWRYRARNTKAKYTPHWEHSTMEEFIWWAIPFEIVLVLAALTWGGTHALDPERAIVSTEKPITVQVVALPWKWLFIYPEEGVASVNELTIPAGRPVEFQITADAPMNSFWIPALGGQMYAMTGMVTELNLIADKTGEYPGVSANYSGEGFAQMRFMTRAVSADEFATWVAHAKESPDMLDETSYAQLAKPSDAGPVRYYGSIPLPFMTIVHASMGMTAATSSMPGMDMGTMTHH